MTKPFMRLPHMGQLPDDFELTWEVFDRALRLSEAPASVASRARVRLDGRPTATGKTQELLAFLRTFGGGPVLIFAPTTKLAAQLRGRFIKLGAPRADTELYVGQTQVDPDTGEPICRFAEAADQVAKAGGKPRQLCAREIDGKRITCPHHDECAYQRKRKAKPCFWFLPHAMLTQRPPPAVNGAVPLVVIDEDPGGTLRQTISVNVNVLHGLPLSDIDVEKSRLASPRGDRPSRGAYEDGSRYNCSDGGGNEAARAFAEKLLQQFQRAVRQAVDVGDGVLRIRTSDLPYPRDLRELRRLLWKLHLPFEVRPLVAGVRPPDLSKYEARNRQVRRACDLLRALERASAFPDCEFAMGVFMHEGRDAGRLITAPDFQKVHKFCIAPTALLSATAEPSLLAHHWNKLEVLETGPPAARYFDNARFIRCVDTMSKTSLIGQDGAALTAKGRKLLRFIEAKAVEHRRKGAFIDGRRVDVLLVAQKAVIERLREVGFPANVDTAHFNAVEGKDQWKDVACVLIVGRPLPPPLQLLAVAERVAGKNLDYAKWWEKRPAVVPCIDRQSGETYVGANFWAEHGDADPVLEAVVRTVCDAAVLQADRSRAVRRTSDNPVEVVMMNALDIQEYAFDEVIDWKDVAPWHAVMAARGLALDPNARNGKNAVIGAVLPDQFSDAKAVENAFRTSDGRIPAPPFKAAVRGRIKLRNDARYRLPVHIDALTASTARGIVEDIFGADAELELTYAPIKEVKGQPERLDPQLLFPNPPVVPPPAELRVSGQAGDRFFGGGGLQ